jgi:hypothetical protein
MPPLRHCQTTCGKLEAKCISSVNTSRFSRELRDIWQTYLDSGAKIATEWKEYTQKQQAKNDDLLDSAQARFPACVSITRMSSAVRRNRVPDSPFPAHFHPLSPSMAPRLGSELSFSCPRGLLTETNTHISCISRVLISTSSPSWASMGTVLQFRGHLTGSGARPAEGFTVVPGDVVMYRSALVEFHALTIPLKL